MMDFQLSDLTLSFHDFNSYSLSIELASAPNADATHPATKGETLDNLLRKILSSRVTI